VRGIDRDVDVTDEEAVRRVFETYRPDVTYHLAALTHVGESWDHANEFTRVNVVGTHRVLDAAFDAVPSSTTVVVSTSEGVRDRERRRPATTRDVSCRPRKSLFVKQGRSRARGTRRSAMRLARTTRVIARPFNHLGPGQSSSFVVPALVTRLLDARERGEREIAVGDLSTRRDFF